MATLTSFLSFSSLPPPPFLPPISFTSAQTLSLPLRLISKYPTAISRSTRTLVFARSLSHSNGPTGDQENSSSKKSVLANLIQAIEPLDVGIIQKDVPPTTVDAMKRTISKMLGLLPSDQFKVSIEALWEPLSKLLINSMMTGYTMWNAEYRLCLERNLLIHEESIDNKKDEDSKLGTETIVDYSSTIDNTTGKDNVSVSEYRNEGSLALLDFDDMNPETRKYILSLQSRLLSAKRELREVKRKSEALQMQQFVGEEENDLLDFLRSLQPEKVAELSEPTSSELKETIHSVVHGLLATLSPKMHSKAFDVTSTGTLNIGDNPDKNDVANDTSLHFQPQILLTRDYLARLLFWCMLLGHYLRGLEYRLELKELLALPYKTETNTSTAEFST